MMISIFPELFGYSFLATFVLRVALGAVFIVFAYTTFFRDRNAYMNAWETLIVRSGKIFLGVGVAVNLIIGVLLVVGAFTQIAALAGGIIAMLGAGAKIKRPHLLPHSNLSFYLFLAVVSFSMIFIGPGAFAIDLPL